MRSSSPRVIVIGGGAAGLAAAATLHRRHPVTLLEARDRVGGRVHSRVDPVLGVALEHGAEFVHGRPRRTLALAGRAGARVLEIPARHDRRERSRTADAGEGFARAEELLGLGTDDHESFRDLLRRTGAMRRHPATAGMAEAFVRGFYLADPRTASSLALARMTHGMDEIEGDSLSRIEGGYTRIFDPLVRTLRRGGVDLRLSTVVEEIRWKRGEVRVRARSATGSPLAPIEGRAVLITVPVSLLRTDAIRFVPGLPEKRRAAAAIQMGAVVKVILRFRRAPWRSVRRGLVFLHVEEARIPVFWTLAPLDAPILVGWAGGPDAARLAPMSERQVVVAAVASAARGLGRPVHQLEEQLDAVTVVDWTRDPFALGGYAVFPIGSAGAVASLARSVEGTLFFAGEATAGPWAGTVDGALETGARAAREIDASS